MPCICALTFIVILSMTNVDVQSVYAEPLHCKQGTFSYDPKKDSFVFRRVSFGYEERVTIPLPHPNVLGTFNVFYCWGQATAIVGNKEVEVLIEVFDKAYS